MDRVTKIRVLIAEDDPAVRGALANLISGEPDFDLVRAVGTAPEAIAAAEREQPDVVLVDVRMPGGGATAARGVRQRAPGAAIITLSGQDDPATVREMLEAGAGGYLVKGSAVSAIADSVRKAADGMGSLSVEVTGPIIRELTAGLTAQRRAEEEQRTRQHRIRRVLWGNGGLRIVFQPICALTGETVGAEALARFPGPPKRPPDRWFAEAGTVGRRRELELAAVRAALEQLPQLPAGTYLTVNLSPATLTTPQFRKLVSGGDGARMVVEVTEHAPIEDYGGLNRALGPVRELGIRLAVDDVGAGFASLRHILRLRPEFIKLDRTLVVGINRDRSRQALIAGLISFAARIDATIVAEGIEQRAEVEALTDLGVTYGQGFFFGRPGPLPFPTRRSAGERPRATAVPAAPA